MPWFWKEWSHQQGVGLLARLLGPFFERVLFKLPVNIVHTVSEASKQDLVDMGMRRRIVVVPNGIDPDTYQTRRSFFTNPHQAIYIGRLVFYKNLGIVFRAFRRIVGEVLDAELLIVGDGPMRASWEKTIGQLNLDKHIHFLGQVSNEQKIRLLEESAFLILPSLVEGFGIVILEAFACRKPVLASDIEALREVVTEGVDGYLLNAASDEEWARKMILLFTHPIHTRRLGSLGERKLTSHYSIQRVAKRMETLYQDPLRGD
jgi:glycosyltransferase involved in cell wall biosynthesis